jgi:hypothetical protein
MLIDEASTQRRVLATNPTTRSDIRAAATRCWHATASP